MTAAHMDFLCPKINYLMKKIILLFLILTAFNLSAQEFTTRDSITIRLRSGNELSAIVVHNKGVPQPLPALVRYSIYASPQTDKYFNSLSSLRGYVGVTVYIRGKYLSTGEVKPFANDATDAWDMIDWVSKQSWCNGKVGMYGASYLGFSQWAAVKKLHPALKTIVPQSAVGIGVDFPSHNNINMGYMLNWIHYATDRKLLDSTSMAQFSDQKKWTRLFNSLHTSGKSFASLDKMEGRPSSLFQEWLAHPSYDEYWAKFTPTSEEYAKLDIPVLTIAGYFDVDQSGAMHYFKKHNENNPGAKHYLVLGPYDHIGLQQLSMPKMVAGYKLDSAAIFKTYKLTFDWFDYVLKDGLKPAMLKDRINFQVMGENSWNHASTLADISRRHLKYFLRPEEKDGVYQLSQEVFKGTKTIKQKIDFHDRSDTISNKTKNLLLDSAINVGRNCLVFETGKFEQAVKIAGSLDGELSFIVNKKDMDLKIQLYEKLADGRYLKLNDDMLRASYSKDHSKRQLITPGVKTMVQLTGNTFFVSRKIAVGSKLVLVLGVPVEAGIEVNHGSGKQVSAETIEDAKEDLIVKWLPSSYISLKIL